MKRNFKFLFTLVMIVVSMIFSSFSVFAEGEKKDEFEWVGVDGGTLNYKK
ncbi:MAG: hypothetical protein N4A48_01730 [Tepidibacter sp.]|nr:hypothetical protein [Tepidibacter sp.]MCT4507475.1 hypothetical protein [Tepidibacter sp.]